MNNTFWYGILQQFILWAIPIVLGPLVALLIAKVKTEYAKWKNEHANIAYTIENIVRFAVYAAEQAGASGFIKDKKVYAIQVAQAYLDKVGIKLDLSSIEAAIESMVAQEFNSQRIKEGKYKMAQLEDGKPVMMGIRKTLMYPYQ